MKSLELKLVLIKFLQKETFFGQILPKNNNDSPKVSKESGEVASNQQALHGALETAMDRYFIGSCVHVHVFMCHK